MNRLLTANTAVVLALLISSSSIHDSPFPDPGTWLIKQKLYKLKRGHPPFIRDTVLHEADPWGTILTPQIILRDA